MAEPRALAPGARIGRYEIVAAIGSGGMGEVYRARDPRVGREVAVKLIRADLGADPGRVRRFENEARAAGALDHPNVVVLYDVGEEDATPYIVTELLQGQTLRERLRGGPLPVKGAVAIAAQLAAGLGAAHEKGIVHRDLKPENVFVMKDGRVKILDFGVAKLQPEPVSEAEADTLLTGAGNIVGTVAYMAPEQVRGQPADARSDLFALGVVCYEMLAGRRPFAGESATEIAAAIVRDDPPELPASVPPGLARLVLRCLEKDPARRYRSAHDLGFQLEGLPAGEAPAARRKRLWPIVAVAVALALAVGSLATRWLARPAASATAPAQPTFQRVSFRRGTVWSARFAHDGRTVVYSASWNGGPPQVFSAIPGSPESRPLPGAALFALSAADDMALAVDWTFERESFTPYGTLAQAPLGGGAPHISIEKVFAADYTPTGELVVLRDYKNRFHVEWPIGHVVYEVTIDTYPWALRVSPRGDAVAVVTSADNVVNGVEVRLVDRAGNKRSLTRGWADISSIAWLPSGHEIWLAGNKPGEPPALHAVTLAGEERVVLRLPGDFTIEDIAEDGRVLLTRATKIEGFRAAGPDSAEHDLIVFDQTRGADLSADGRLVIIGTSAVSYKFTQVMDYYVRRLDGGEATPIGRGSKPRLSPDGSRILVVASERPPRLGIAPLARPGEVVPLHINRLTNLDHEAWLPDGRGLVVQGVEPGHEARLYLVDLAGGDPHAFGAEPAYLWPVFAPVSPDGKWVIAHDDKRYATYPTDGSAARPIPAMGDNDVPIRFTADGRSVYVQDCCGTQVAIDTIDLATGARARWKVIADPDPTGSVRGLGVALTADGRTYLYGYEHRLSELYVVTGLR